MLWKIPTALVVALWCMLPPIATADDGAVPVACTDFDLHVNQAWSRSTELADDRARAGNFDALRQANDRLLEAALAELVADPARQNTPGLKLLAAWYRSGLDLEGIERRGLAPVAPLLERIASLQRADLPLLLADFARLRLGMPVVPGVGPDARDATRHVLQIGQAGLGLPDREDYSKGDAESQRVREAYRRYVQRLLAAAGAPAGDAVIDTVLAFEAELARATLTRVQRRDPTRLYNPQTPASLAALAPGFDWAAYLARYASRPAAALDAMPIVLSQPLFAQAFAKLAAEAPLEQWQHFLRVRVLDAMADKLPRAFADAAFDYRQRALRGLQRPPRRAEQLTLAIGGGTGFAPLAQTLGELYVAKNFSPVAQRRALAMVDDIRAAMAERIRSLTWMGEATKRFALAKLESMVAQIGAPEQWQRYEGLELDPSDYAGNDLRVSEWATQRGLADLGRPVDRRRWNTSPHIVNAFASGGNRIVFPAGILQPPFFDERADDASNYGAIGSVIGHEISHHFDDRGRQFDAAGNLRDWWTAEDAAAYKARAERLAVFYAQYEPVPGVRINGHQMLGENISDLAGVRIAYDGLQRALARRRAAGEGIPLIDGQTPEQRFFIANATIWRSKARIEQLTQQLRTGVHSPGRWRVLGPLTNLPAFAQAFGCKAGDAMVAVDPIVIW